VSVHAQGHTNITHQHSTVWDKTKSPQGKTPPMALPTLKENQSMYTQ
jgi:hypothetical protein